MNVADLLMAQDSLKNYLRQKQFQLSSQNFRPATQIVVTLAPEGENTALYYKLLFGHTMVPHQFNTIVMRGDDTLFGGIVSGQAIARPIDTFSLKPDNWPLELTITNLRNLTGYFELTVFYLEIHMGDYNKVVSDIQEMNRVVVGVEGGQALTMTREGSE
jgi:hypothetical protein